MPYVYANLAALKLHNDKRMLVQLTNDDDTVDPNDHGGTDGADPGVIDESVLMACENDAAATINNYLRNVYDVPLTGGNITTEIVAIAARLTWCNLWQRKGDESEQVTELRRTLKARLKDMGSPRPDENLQPTKNTMSMPVRFKGGKTRTIFDHAGYFDGLPSQGTRTLPADDDPTD